MFSVVSAVADENGWRYYYTKAELQYGGERYAFAKENYVRALDLNPELYEAANRLADIHIKQSNKRIALDYYRMSLKIKETQPDIHNLTGELCEFFGYYEDAYIHYTRTVELDRDNVKARFNLVRHHLRTGDRAGADKHFEACFQAGKARGNVLFMRARKVESEGNDTEAARLYGETIVKNPAHIEAYFRLVEVRRRQKKTGAAITVLEKLKEVRPDNAKAHRYLGHLYFTEPVSAKRRRYYLDLAVKNLKKALALDPADSDARFLLSDVYRHRGEIEKAVEIQNQAKDE